LVPSETFRLYQKKSLMLFARVLNVIGFLTLSARTFFVCVWPRSAIPDERKSLAAQGEFRWSFVKSGVQQVARRYVVMRQT